MKKSRQNTKKQEKDTKSFSKVTSIATISYITSHAPLKDDENKNQDEEFENTSPQSLDGSEFWI